MNHGIATAPQPTPGPELRRGPAKSSEEALVVEYLPIIRRMAGSIMRRLPAHLRVDDLEAAGILGLLQAAQRQDPLRAEQFDAYARCKIECAMLDELRKHDVVPKDVRNLSRRIVAAMSTVEHRDGKVEEAAVAAELGATVDEYRVMLERTADIRLLSLETITDLRDTSSELTSRQPNALESMMFAEACVRVARAIRRLPDKQRKVLALYYLEELTLKEIGLALDLTQARVCQLHSEAVHAVRMTLDQEEERKHVI